MRGFFIMKKITLENLYSELTENDVVIVYQDKSAGIVPAPLMLLTTFISHEKYNSLYYGFMNMLNPLILDRSYEQGNKYFSITEALKAGHEIYAAESFGRIHFSGENSQRALPDIIRDHSEYMIKSLSMNQYPVQTYRTVTERFIKQL